MIVDLLRNDLSRVARPGSVAVPELFAVETYPTLLQLTSTVTAELEEGLGPIDLIQAPSTPAARSPARPRSGRWRSSPRWKRRPRSRLLRRDRQACAGRRSRVQCRDPDAGHEGGRAGRPDRPRLRHRRRQRGRRRMARMSGEGSVCGDGPELRSSRDDALRPAGRRRRPRSPPCPDEGQRRCARFPLRPARGAQRPPGGDLPRRAEPCSGSRSRAAARWRSNCGRWRPRPRSRSRSRSRRSRSRPTISACATRPATAPFTTTARAASGAFEIVFADPEGFLTEGSFTSLFVERGGTLLTPPLARGLLPGVLRARLLDEGRAKEADLTEADLADGFLIGNAVRGLVRARLRSPGAGARP